MSDMLATAYGSLGLMTSVLVSPSGAYEYEAAHGTVTRHYYQYLEGKKESTNPIATIFAWTGALKKRGELDEDDLLSRFASDLERASVMTMEEGVMDKNLSALSKLTEKKIVNSEEFLFEIRDRLERIMR